MADNSAEQALLSRLTEPPERSQKMGTFKKRRFRRCKTTPSGNAPMDLDKDNGSSPVSSYIFKNFRPSFRTVFSLLGLYLILGAVCFYFVRHQIVGKRTNAILDAVYFCIVTMTTVGYGDLVPDSAETKLLACAFVFSGMAIIALFLSKAADYLVEKQEVLLVKALHYREKVGKQQLLREIETERVKYKLFSTTAALLVLAIAGTVVLVKVEKLSIVDAFYCVCATITTLGYGDKSFSTTGGRVFAVFWILAGTIGLAQFFLYLAELQAEQRQKSLIRWVLTRRMTFVDLEAADLDDDGLVSPSEFVLYKLKEIGKISEEDIAIVMEEFENLDVDQSGTISYSDLVLAQLNS